MLCHTLINIALKCVFSLNFILQNDTHIQAFKKVCKQFWITFVFWKFPFHKLYQIFFGLKFHYSNATMVSKNYNPYFSWVASKLL